MAYQLPEMLHPTWIEIDLKQFKKNVISIKNRLKKTKFCLPVKANAYGHGLYTMSKTAQDLGVDYLAVSFLSEGQFLREKGIKIPILVLGAIHEMQIENLIKFDLEFTISSLFKAQIVASYCEKLKKKCSIHIEIDTGMHRTGIRPSTLPSLLNFIQTKSCFILKGIYSHFATADLQDDKFTLKQIEDFQKVVSAVNDNSIIFHLANSAGICYFPSSFLQMARPGLLAYGYYPNKKVDIDVSPCFSLKSKVSYFKAVFPGQGISYGHTYITKKMTRVVTVPIGYGDGYPRILSNKGSVLIRNQQYPIIGNICMDQFMVDISLNESFVGDEIVLIGKQGNLEIKVEEIAELCSTIPYEILCSFNERIPRIYI